MEVREFDLGDKKVKGLWIRAKIWNSGEANLLWDQIKSGAIKGFSIGGVATEYRVAKLNNGGHARVITKFELDEISLTAAPANELARVMAVSVAKGFLCGCEEVMKAVDRGIVITKPFAGFEDWDDCMKEMRKRYDEETAKKVCGKLKAEYEEKNKVEKFEFGGNWDDCMRQMRRQGYPAEDAERICGKLMWESRRRGKSIYESTKNNIVMSTEVKNEEKAEGGESKTIVNNDYGEILAVIANELKSLSSRLEKLEKENEKKDEEEGEKVEEKIDVKSINDEMQKIRTAIAKLNLNIKTIEKALISNAIKVEGKGGKVDLTVEEPKESVGAEKVDVSYDVQTAAKNVREKIINDAGIKVETPRVAVAKKSNIAESFKKFIAGRIDATTFINEVKNA